MFQTSDPVVSALLLIGIVGLVLYLLFKTRSVTVRSLLLPVAAALFLGARCVDWANPTAVLAVGAGTLLGIAVGTMSGRLVPVWRAEDGRVYQRGSTRYAAVLVGLITLRILAYAFVVRGMHGPDAAALSEGFWAMAAGLFLGRTASVGARALGLVGWDLSALAPARTHAHLSAR
jgi:hypothetical protein